MTELKDPPPPYRSSPASIIQPNLSETSPLLPSYEEPYEEPTPRQTLETRARPDRKRRWLFLILNLFAWLCVALFLAVLLRSWYYAKSDEVSKPEERNVRIAIVGAGPAGVSAAWTLASEAKAKNAKLEIVIIEQKAEVGGRVAVGSELAMKGLGRKMHASDIASAYLGLNSVLGKRARTVMGIEYGKKSKGEGVEEVGFFDGREMRSRSTRPGVQLGWVAWLGLVWKYGPSVWRARALPCGTMKDFERFLEGRGTFESVGAMVEAAEMGGAVGRHAMERLRLNMIDRRYVNEVLGPQVLRQTGQWVDGLSDLAISMALQREDSVSGGDDGSFEEVLKKFVEESRAELRLNTKVSGLKKEPVAEGKKSWILEVEQLYGDRVKTYESFDKVILAGPWETNPLRIDNITEEEEVCYRSLWVTFVLSDKELSSEYFGTSDQTPSQILPIPSANLPAELEGIHEISHVADVFGPDLKAESVSKLYRFFSIRSLPRERLALFVDDKRMESYAVEIENAYPLNWPRKGGFGKFKIQEGLWHTGVLEAIGSSVDLSWVAGENVGRLVVEDLKNN